MSKIITLIDAYVEARKITDAASRKAGQSDAAEAMYDSAVAAEEGAVERCIAELRRLEPELTYQTARCMIAVPAYRNKVVAMYAGKEDASQ